MNSLPRASFSRLTDGFSLPEILIIVSIISLLAALSFPAFNRVRAASRMAKATSNMRNIYIGIMAYHQEYSRLPPCPNQVAGEDSWNQFVAPYVDPGFRRPKGTANQLPSVFYDPAALSNYLRGDFGVLLDDTYGPFCRETSLSLLQLTHLPRTPLLFTAEQKSSKGQTVGAFFVTNFGSASAPQISERHNGKALVVFGDGAVAATTKEELTDEGLMPFRNR